jgi:hypothetical protein
MATQCKLFTNTDQSIPPNTWTVVLFDEVLRNDAAMFKGTAGVLSNRKNGLITPPRGADFIWCRFVQWESIEVDEKDVRVRQFMEQFCRDPYGVQDSTASTDGPDTPGKEFNLGSWVFRGDAGEPVGVRVWHDHNEAVKIVHAQFSATTWDF